jgi:chemotaxis protein CheX
MGKTAIKAEHVNPFILSTMETFSKMLGVEAKPGKTILKRDGPADHDISGFIGLSGGAKGMVVLSFPKETALRATNKFMGANHAEINAETMDAVGELANIVVGNAKKGLAELHLTISLPSVITGGGHHIMDSKGVYSFVIPFHTDLGDFQLTVSLKAADED